MNAACDEAKKQGLRSLVHAFRDAVRAATLVGCTEVEHGLGASDEDLKLLAEHGTYVDPQAGLLLETYLQYKSRYLAPPYYTEEGFAAMGGLIQAHQQFIRRAVQIPGLKIVYGTDAVAGSHGRNAEDFIHRVRDSGVDPMAAMVSANALGAEAANRKLPGYHGGIDLLSGHTGCNPEAAGLQTKGDRDGRYPGLGTIAVRKAKKRRPKHLAAFSCNARVLGPT